MVIFCARCRANELRGHRIRFEKQDVESRSLLNELFLSDLLLLPEVGILWRQGLFSMPLAVLNMRLD